MTIHGALREFANTFKEWHYFIGGFSSGVVTGILLMFYLAVKLAQANRDNTK